MKLHGRNFIGSSLSAEGTESITAVNPLTGECLSDAFTVATESEVDRAVKLASKSVFAKVSSEQRALFLRTAASKIDDLGESLLTLAHEETGLPIARLTGERTRTVNQLRLFADLVAEGSWVDARIDTAEPDRLPLPKPDFRRMLTGIGPVAVFGASNFPLAYSVAGGDTVSAFAAGCPVIVKAHPAHPGTSELTANAIVAAAKEVGMPEGTFSMVHGGRPVGLALIKHDDLTAVGFTGSHAGGRALLLAASARAKPIPVFAEMGSTNPLFLLPEALERKGDIHAKQIAQSVTLGVGQYCTNPGLIVALAGPELDKFKTTLVKHIEQTSPGAMLTEVIRDNFYTGLESWAHSGAKALLPWDKLDHPGSRVYATVFETDAATFLHNRHLAEEVFGPVTLIIKCETVDDLYAVAQGIPGQLTASVHGEPNELKEHDALIQKLSLHVGRLIFNGYPTSVEVTPAMNHGGPYPASSDVRFTSVGTAAIYRFARPLCWQDAPNNHLPLELQNSNPRNITRLVNGAHTKSPLTDQKSRVV